MENNTLLGATDTTANYDGSGVFNPNSPTSDSAPASSSLPDVEENDPSEQKPEESKNNLLMYAGAALLLYFFVFKKK